MAEPQHRQESADRVIPMLEGVGDCAAATPLADAFIAEVGVSKAVREIHARRLMIDVYGAGSPYCAECRQCWPCATEKAIAAVVGDPPLPEGDVF